MSTRSALLRRLRQPFVLAAAGLAVVAVVGVGRRSAAASADAAARIVDLERQLGDLSARGSADTAEVAQRLETLSARMTASQERFRVEVLDALEATRPAPGSDRE